ncbi:MAG: hypothetical protein WCX65_15630, partial [bacterium]
MFWDFTKGAQGWTGNAYVKDIALTNEGLTLKSLGTDPLLSSPAGGLPGDKQLRVTVRMKKGVGDMRASLYYGAEFNREKSARFPADEGVSWREYSVFLPPVGPNARLWLSPMLKPGAVTVAWIRVESVAMIEPPAAGRPARPKPGARPAMRVVSGGVEFVHYGRSWDDFAVVCGGVEMASGHAGGRLGVVIGGKPEWLDLSRAKFKIEKRGAALKMSAQIRDSGGALWTLRRSVSPGARPGALNVETLVVADKARAASHIPWLTLFPGLGTFGARKTQAVFAGLEYLADEPGSSEADLTGPASVRRAPDPAKITFPLMAMAHKGKYIGVIWEPSDRVAAVFDSPDRALGSGAHLMALLAPGVGVLRRENDLYAFDSFSMPAGKALAARMTLLGGTGASVVPAISEYVALKGLPPAPEFEGGFQAAASLLASGWLDSGIGDDGLWRFTRSKKNYPVRAADAVTY